MDSVHAYLLFYLLKIRKHSGELGYLKRRFEHLRHEEAVYEKSMLHEARGLHLIALSDKEHDVTFKPSPGGEEHTVSVPGSFIMLARGHYLWLEYLASGGKWLAASLLGALIALLIAP